MRIRNKSNQALAFPNVPAFKPHEEREVTEEQGAYILANENFEEVESTPKNPTDRKKAVEPVKEQSMNGVDRQQGAKL